MEPLLQPLRTAQLLDRAVHLFRRHFLFFVLLCLPAVVFVAGTGELIRRAFSVIYRERSVQIFFAWIFQIVAYAAAFGGTSALVVFGLRDIESSKPYSAMGCYRAASVHWLRIAGIQILVALRLIGIFFVGVVAPSIALGFALKHYPRFISAFAAWRLILGFGVLLLVAVAMVWMVHSFAKHAFASACCVVENSGTWASLKRSRKLTKGARRRIWTMFFFALCLFIPLSSAAELPAVLTGDWAAHHKTLYESWTLLASMFAMAISAPIVVIGTVLIYYDQRVRREAFDVQTLIQATETHNATHVATQAPSPEVLEVHTSSIEIAERVNAEKPDESPDAMAATSGS